MDLVSATDTLNHRPRKCFGFKTLHEVFMEQLQSN
jgi:IS30 family transposase